MDTFSCVMAARKTAGVCYQSRCNAMTALQQRCIIFLVMVSVGNANIVLRESYPHVFVASIVVRLLAQLIFMALYRNIRTFPETKMRDDLRLGFVGREFTGIRIRRKKNM